MSVYPRNVDQDDVLGEGDVESSAFGGAARHEEDQHAGFGVVEKPKKKPLWLWLIGGVGAIAVLTLAVILLLATGGSGNEDASFAQVTPPAPQPKMDAPPSATANTPSVPAAALAVADGGADPIKGPDTPTTATQTNPEMPVSDAGAAMATATPGAQPVIASSAAPAPPPATAAVEQKSEAERLLELEARYEALAGDHARLNEKFLRALRDAEQRRTSVKNNAVRSASPVATVAAKVSGVQLKAVVDNNAWVQTEAGDTVTVSPGDHIPGVGQVRSVDPETGTVRLSDGRVIR